MSGPNDRGSGSAPPDQRSRHQPLVIVSEQGRRTDESRRIVRAQAARASAAQSRVTRARNRGEREGSSRDGVSSPPAQDHQESASPSSSSILPGFDPGRALGQKPLAAWLPSVVSAAMGNLADQAVDLTTQAPSLGALGRATSNFAGLASQTLGGAARFRLPMALPRGFTALQQRLEISDSMISLLTRTACIDYVSPGVEGRLHQLLFDLIIKAGSLGLITQSGHPIQSHLRIAATCLTIYQGQHANGACFANDRRYILGLEAAWSEVLLLDKAALSEPKSAEASLWAVFMISVTTGATAGFFYQQLHTLLQDLQLQYWEQVRRVLLEFIYPVSFVDQPCKTFYHSLQAQVAAK